MTKILKICCSEWRNASRDKRELNCCRDLGMDVLVMAKGVEGTEDFVDGFKVHRMGTRPLGRLVPVSFNRLWSFIHWAKEAKKINPDIISGHDLEGLFIGYLSVFYKKRALRPKLIYDSHEFEMGRSRTTGHQIQYYISKFLEKYLMKRSDLSIFVSNKIREETLRIHKIEVPTIVVRNIPYYWNIDKEAIDKKRVFLESILGNNRVILMYHGALFKYRGIEQMLKVLPKRGDTAAFILGNGTHEYEEELHRLVDNLGIKDRVFFHPAVSMDELLPLVGAADIGFAIMEKSTLSYYYSLPNKLFENIQALTPVIVSNFPELSNIVNHYDIGVPVDPYSMEEIIFAVDRMKGRINSSALEASLQLAKKELCWENEKKILLEAYKTL